MAEKEYIERGMLIEEARNNKAVCQSLADIVDIQDIINNVPVADIQPVVHAKWIPWGRDSAHTRFIHCSRCNFEVAIYEDAEDPYYIYCPRCGAKMDGEKK